MPIQKPKTPEGESVQKELRPEGSEPTLETAAEVVSEQSVEKPVAEKEAEASSPVTLVSPVPPVSPEVRSDDFKAIESILAKDLEDLYNEMPPNRQQEFKKAGEQTASKIERLFQAAKVKMNKVVDLIKGWLAMIPGVNKFFLEQEAKLKADEIMELKENRE